MGYMGYQFDFILVARFCRDYPDMGMDWQIQTSSYTI